MPLALAPSFVAEARDQRGQFVVFGLGPGASGCHREDF